VRHAEDAIGNPGQRQGRSSHQARQHLRDFLVFDIVQVTPGIIEEGVDCSILHTISFWDGLIVASASTAKCTELISEDLAGGQMIRGITIINPFR
jgi:predicted nucleic acid-binding protein